LSHQAEARGERNNLFHVSECVASDTICLPDNRSNEFETGSGGALADMIDLLRHWARGSSPANDDTAEREICRVRSTFRLAFNLQPGFFSADLQIELRTSSASNNTGDLRQPGTTLGSSSPARILQA
jgi:hypothetical protein